jgi:excisionase family DNA binding protein
VEHTIGKKLKQRKHTNDTGRIDPERLLLKAAEVARRLSFARSTVYAMMAAGELEVVRKGRAIRVPVSSVTRWIDSHARQVA